ncbi:MAG: YraN family protein [Gammaproteobacteria bacterium]
MNPGVIRADGAARVAHSWHVSTNPNLARGIASEQLAAEYLLAHGLKFLARNLRCRVGELDLVCLEGGVLAIVEVRQRARSDFGGALGSVTHSKQRKIIRATRFFWQRTRAWRAYPMRFDVVGVERLPDGSHRIHWIRDAFRAT